MKMKIGTKEQLKRGLITPEEALKKASALKHGATLTKWLKSNGVRRYNSRKEKCAAS